MSTQYNQNALYVMIKLFKLIIIFLYGFKKEEGFFLRINTKNRFFDYAIIYIGTVLMAISLTVFFEPNNIVAGGATGIATIIKHLTEGIFDGGISLGISNVAINLPLFLIAMKIFGLKFIFKTFVATLMLSFNLEITKFIPTFFGDLIVASIFGGLLSGVGLALIFRAGATTGGSDMAASIIGHKLKQYTIASIMLVIDVIIIIGGYFVFGINAALYAIISIFITSKVIDTVLEGFSFAKATFIISSKAELICNEVFQKLDRGVTSFQSKGMFSGKSNNVLMCVVSKKQVHILKEIVKEADENAFVIVADVREVLGEGF